MLGNQAATGNVNHILNALGGTSTWLKKRRLNVREQGVGFKGVGVCRGGGGGDIVTGNSAKGKGPRETRWQGGREKRRGEQGAMEKLKGGSS